MILEHARENLGVPDLALEVAVNADEVVEAFKKSKFDHVFIGAGLELEERLAVVRAIYQASDTTTVHLKDVASGPNGFLPFVSAIVSAL